MQTQTVHNSNVNEDNYDKFMTMIASGLNYEVAKVNGMFIDPIMSKRQCRS